MKRSDHKSPDQTRRAFLARLAALPAAARFSRAALAAQQPPVTMAGAPHSRAFNFASLKSWITPTHEFFIRSHFGVPRIEAASWTVTVSGAVARERRFTIGELLKLASREEVVTLECAGNPVGWGGVSNARWAGVSLAALLQAAGVTEGAREVLLVGADGGAEREAGGIKVDAFARSIPLAKAMDLTTLLAYRMNGEPLTPAHGGPLRAIVPGWYGMDSVKWIKQIIVSRESFKVFYQTERYYEARRVGGRIERGPLEAMRLKSQIARPINGETLKVGPVQVVGAGWTGDGEITRVELSFDGGRMWKWAELGADRAPFAWRLWSYEWTPPEAGRYEIIARAYDSRGRVQPLERDPALVTPYANNWADRRSVEVR